MSCLYVTEQGATLTMESGRMAVLCKNGMKRTVPIETLESITLFGGILMTAQAQKACLEHEIRVLFLSTRGKYFGRLESTKNENAYRLKKQVYLSDNEEKILIFVKKILAAKMHNQYVLLRRYARSSDADIQKEIKNITIYESKVEGTVHITEAMGYEGMAAREYFAALSKLVKPEFKFCGRSKRPPKDPFNSMLSLGYTVLLYEIYAEIEARGFSPYIGLMHQIKEKHPALASDLLEEWRAVIVDAAVLSLVQGNEITPDSFESDEATGAVTISAAGVKCLVQKLEQKMRKEMHYLLYLENGTSFRRAIWWQVKTLSACIEAEDFSAYKPLMIR